LNNRLRHRSAEPFGGESFDLEALDRLKAELRLAGYSQALAVAEIPKTSPHCKSGLTFFRYSLISSLLENITELAYLLFQRVGFLLTLL